DNSPMRKVTGGLVPAALWKEVMTAAEQGLPPRPLDRTPEPANVSESFADQQVSYVDDVDAATPQLPQDAAGEFMSGSGVTPGRVARNDERSDPPAYSPPYVQVPQNTSSPSASSYPRMTLPSPLPPQMEQPPRQPERDVEAPRQNPSNYPTRQAADEMSDYRRWLQTQAPSAR